LDGAVLEQGAFLLRFGRGRDVRLLLAGTIHEAVVSQRVGTASSILV
jgi:hypothetical protein